MSHAALEPRRTKKKDIYVISTAKRPVPLEHYLYAGKELWKIVDASRTYMPEGYTNSPFSHVLMVAHGF